jgi:DNA repair exonuclease SbcCD nuclease subunit
LDAGTASALGFAFALLGHEHKGYIWPEERPICAYPGTPELFSEGEASGLHGALLLTVGNEGEMPRVEHIPLAQWRYLSVTVNLDGCTGRADAANQIRRSLPSGPSLDEERLIVTVTLEGVPPFDLDQEALREELGTRAHVRFDDHTVLPYDLEQLAQERTIRGLLVERFIRRVEAAQSERDRRVAEQALKFALAALDGKPVRVAQTDIGTEVQSAR